ncbi:hypothetical protein FCL40_02995 [Ferrimonas sediminicola]|uniref:Uncharacterized protein n=1 Tax=Ferrimonas sediminicola TaxID=2569538 RepID=A0A4U1BJ38_9GAMM|nr:hypothetical protein [Ferrimonas sediminicola]TKB51536.1 hypothetical protein FCL40_02995 [Ferrimonas sediminicola]
MLLLVAKIMAAVVAVVGLAWIAERSGPRLAGVLSGYPLGTAIVLFFYGIEHGPEFAAQAALYGQLGLAATTGYCLVYTLSAQGAEPKAWRPMAVAVMALVLFALVAQSLPPMGAAGALLAAAVALLSIRITRRVPEPEFVAVKAGPMMVWGRALLAAAIVVVITALAHWLPESLAGVMAAFPVTLFPLMLLLQLEYGNRPVAVLAKHYPFGVGSLIVYGLSVWASYPALGVGMGTLASFGAATLYLMLFLKIRGR